MISDQEVADAVTDYGLQRTPAAVLCRLMQSPGRFVTTQDLRSAMEEITGNRATELGVRSAVKLLRKALRRADAPIQIETANGIGYRVVVPTEHEDAT